MNGTENRKISAVICEYNPFHNGHEYMLRKMREGGATHIIACMSGNFTQRGEAAVFDKYTSAKLLSIELDLMRNKKLTRIYEYAKTVLSENPKDKTAKNVMDLLKDGADLPPDIYPFLQLDQN